MPLITTGSDFSSSLKEARRIRLLNLLLLIIIFVLGAMGLLLILTGDTKAGLLDFGFVMLAIAMYIGNRLGFYHYILASTLILFGVVNVFFAYIYPETAYNQYAFFALAMFPFLFYDKFVQIVLFAIYYLVLFYWVELNFLFVVPRIDNINEHAFEYFFTTGASFLALCLISYYFKYEHFRYEKIIKDAELELRKTNTILEKEKERAETLLLNILPEQIVDELKDQGSSKPRLYSDVTVLFSDFVNFTHKSSDMNPEELVGNIDYCFRAFDRIIEHYKLEKIKTIGDAYLAVCGLPVESEDHAKRVIAAALEIQDFLKYNSAKFQARIGIHSGPVVAGIVGIKKYAYDIWGDTVNTAARMEQHSMPDKINISATTYELVKGDYNCIYRGDIEAKGKGRVAMYYVEKKHPIPI